MICDNRSLLFVVVLVRSIPSLTVPDITLKKMTSPICCSILVLKTNRFVDPEALQGTSFPLVSLGAGKLSGELKTLVMNSIKRLTPISFLAEIQNTGNIPLVFKPAEIPERISSSVSPSFSKKSSISFSSFSAAFSTSSFW